ncbi:cytochrome-c peroxidase [Sessilibacter corallicola]|uniref:Diheme cytochrome c5 peroxidase CcpA n=1 Tax=Sessilibacter corallicola TaxID=2904075 RepID=A0ABQ0A428_9GAMM
MINRISISALVASLFVLSGCGGSGGSTAEEKLSARLTVNLEAASNGVGIEAFMLPDSDDFDNIPQDPNNPITAAKVELGQMLYHETALATAGVNSDRTGTWSCASCHHAAAGFKAGVVQGIAEGGEGFGIAGETRVLVSGFDALSSDPTLVPDVQPVTSPAVLNVAFQEVMLWNGQFGNMEGGFVNIGLDDNVLSTPGTPKAHNSRQLAGVEIQAVAGLGVHRLSVTDDSILQTNADYQALFNAAFPDGSDDVLEDAAKAIAAFERTIIANQSPFQLWLRGDQNAMSAEELRGANLFFESGCSDCHRGAALSSDVGATEDEIFFAIGFADFDPNNSAVTGNVPENAAKGRGGFTGESSDDYKFKIPQLYNLADTNVFGHGASFDSVRDLVAFKNTGLSQKLLPEGVLDSRVVPLGLSEQEIDDLTAFLETALYDPNLERFVPSSVPSGNCTPVNDAIAQIDLSC